MNRTRSYLLSFIIISFLTWLICPWNNSSLAAKSFDVSHVAHGHSSGHEEETHHASKGNDHSCVNPISYSKEDTSSKITPIYFEYQSIEVYPYQVTSVTSQLSNPHPPKFLIHLYQFYSVYLL